MNQPLLKVAETETSNGFWRSYGPGILYTAVGLVSLPAAGTVYAINFYSKDQKFASPRGAIGGFCLAVFGIGVNVLTSFREESEMYSHHLENTKINIEQRMDMDPFLVLSTNYLVLSEITGTVKTHTEVIVSGKQYECRWSVNGKPSLDALAREDLGTARVQIGGINIYNSSLALNIQQYCLNDWNEEKTSFQ